MTILFQQTDTASLDAIASFCSPSIVGISTDSRTASQSGVAGTTTPAITLQASKSDRLCVMWETRDSELNGYILPAGNWTAPINITTGTGTASLVCVISSVWICRINNLGVNQQTIGSLTGLAVDVSNSGIQTFTVVGSAVTFNQGDRLTVSVAFTNGDVVNHAFNYKPNQVISAPGPIPTPLLYLGVKFPGTPMQPVKERAGVTIRPTWALKKHIIGRAA